MKAGNLDPFNRPILKGPDGSIMTTKSISIGTPQGEVVIPTIVNGKQLTNREAIEEYKKNGKHFGIFDSPENAELFARQLSQEQGRRWEKDKRAFVDPGRRLERLMQYPEMEPRGVGHVDWQNQRRALRISPPSRLHVYLGTGRQPLESCGIG